MTSSTTAVQRHYSSSALTSRVPAVLKDSGFSEDPVEWSKLAAIDQFHVRGLEATLELAEALGIEGGGTVLDVGSGFAARHASSRDSTTAG